MNITQKFASIALPLSLLAVAPYATAQIAPVGTGHAIIAETDQTVSAETVKLAEQTYAGGKIEPRWRDKEVALNGRDIVSYGQDSGPIEGEAKYAAEFDDTKWYFKSKENRDSFIANPNKYVPEFGGYCPVALSQGEVKIGTSTQFTRHEGRTYLNYNRANRDKFATDPESFVLKARATF